MTNNPEHKKIRVRLSGFASIQSMEFAWEGRLEQLDEWMQEIATKYHALYWRADVFVGEMSATKDADYPHFATYQFKVLAIRSKR